MEAVTILAIGFVCMACFLSGVNVGQKLVKGEEVKLVNGEKVKLPAIKPAKEEPVKQPEEVRMSRDDIILQNIDNYDGTGQGQADVPWR